MRVRGRGRQHCTIICKLLFTCEGKSSCERLVVTLLLAAAQGVGVGGEGGGAVEDSCSREFFKGWGGGGRSMGAGRGLGDQKLDQ